MENKLPKYRIEQELEGLPEHYPTLNHNDDFVFYIQRNINQNTVIYSINYNAFGDINMNSPLRMHWKKFEEDGQTQALNALQENIAYGYKSQIINKDAFSFQFLAYNKLNFFLVNEENTFKVVCKINGKESYLSKIYVQLDINGIFPQGKFYELYGKDKETTDLIYEKKHF